MYTTFDNSHSFPHGVNLTNKLNSGSFNVMIVGLGGLGVVSLAQKLRNLIALRYPHVHTIEQRGIAQRRSSTSAVISAADFFVSPSLSETKVTLLIALEPLEALRYSHLLEPDGICFISDSRIETICGGHLRYAYPGTEDIVKSIEINGAACLRLPTANWLKTEQLLAIHASSAMLGMFCAAFDFDHQSVSSHAAKSKSMPADPKNLTAFRWGFRQFHKLWHAYETARQAKSHPAVPLFLQANLDIETAA